MVPGIRLTAISVGLITTLALACSSTPSILAAEQTRHADQTAQVFPTETLRPTKAAASPGLIASSPTSPAGAQPMGPSGFPADVDPLTGVKVESPALLDRRPLGLEYANFPVKVRPQSGLSLADLVFEHATGQGTTRFLAFFYGQNASRAGPVTSGQWVDGELVRLYRGILGVSGAIPEVDKTLHSQLPGRLFSAGPSLCPALCFRDVANESAFSDTAALSRHVSDLTNGGTRPSLDGYVFDPQPPDGGEPADFLHVVYAQLNHIGWTYDPHLGAYLREQDNLDARLAPATDALSGMQLAFQNVIILFAEHDAVRANLLDISLWYEPSRPLLLLRSGRLYRGTWSTAGLDSPLGWFDANGLHLALAPGSTWVEIVSLGSRISAPEPGRWQVDFAP
jgi:hypothetical protein